MGGCNPVPCKERKERATRRLRGLGGWFVAWSIASSILLIVIRRISRGAGPPYRRHLKIRRVPRTELRLGGLVSVASAIRPLLFFITNAQCAPSRTSNRPSATMEIDLWQASGAPAHGPHGFHGCLPLGQRTGVSALHKAQLCLLLAANCGSLTSFGMTILWVGVTPSLA